MYFDYCWSAISSKNDDIFLISRPKHVHCTSESCDHVLESGHLKKETLFQANSSAEIEELRCSETSLKEQLEMSNKAQEQYKETIKGLESKLSQLLDGRASEVDSVVTQLKQAEQVL